MAKAAKPTASSLNWPSFYPAGVPPTNAIDANGTFYRLVNVVPPQPGCFLSTHEEQPNRHKDPRLSADDKINVYGASFFDTHSAAALMKEKFANVLGGRLVAKGELESYMGKMKKTRGPSHFTVWLKVGCGIHNHFS